MDSLEEWGKKKIMNVMQRGGGGEEKKKYGDGGGEVQGRLLEDLVNVCQRVLIKNNRGSQAFLT